MQWYYVEAGQQAGPVQEQQLEELVRAGKIQADTLVWHEGMAAWAPYREVAPAESAPPPAPEAGAPPVVASGGTAGAGGLICSECGRAFSPADVIRYNDKWVCASCKPVFFQRLREGATAGGGAPGALVSEAELLVRDYEVDIGSSLQRGWETFKANAGLMIGATVLVYLAIMGVSLVSNLIPVAGFIVSLFVNGPLMGGLWVFYIKRVRNQEGGLADAFSGFSPRFWQLALTQAIPGLISLGVMGLIGIVMAMTLPTMMVGARTRGIAASAAAHAMLIPLVVSAVIAVLVLLYLSTCWMFALPLAGDKGLNFWPALELSRRVVSKHWWMTFWLMVVCGVLGMLGIFACGLGLLVSGPVAFAMLASHYEKVFGDLAPNPG
jgi:hypothetical protein